MDRLQTLRVIMDDIIRKNPDPEEVRAGFIHLYGVSDLCAILALKRGLDVDLCIAAGMLHDIWNYKVGKHPDHGQLGAVEARKILEGLGSFSPAEIDDICMAISRHSDKQAMDSSMAELLKDADVLHHYLYHPAAFESAPALDTSANPGIKPMRLQRLERTLAELGIKPGE